MSTSKTSIVFVCLFSVLLLASSVEASARSTMFQTQYGTPSTCFNPGFNFTYITAKDVLTQNSNGDDILLKGDPDFKRDAWTLLSAKDTELVNATDAKSKFYDVLNAIPTDIDKCEKYHCPDPVKRMCVPCGSYQSINTLKYQCQVWNEVSSWMDTSTTLSTCGCNCYSPNLDGRSDRRFLEETSTQVDLMQDTYAGLKRKLINTGIDISKFKDKYEDPVAKILTRPTPPSRQSALFLSEPVETRNGFSVEFTMKVDNPWCEITSQRFASVLDLNIPFGKCYSTNSNGVSLNTCFTETTVFTRFEEEMDFNNCGGEGFAFVVKPEKDPLQAIDGMGSGLGYAGLSNVLAIEFDFKTNIEGKDDPTTAKQSRHISLIAKRGLANAVETLNKDEGALAWNDDPINMGDNPTQRGVVNKLTTWRIEYKDQKFNVFWGNSNQLEWTSTKFSFKKYFNTKSSNFYIGFTSSSIGKRGHTIKIGDIKLGTQEFAIDKTSSYMAPFQTGTTLKTTNTACLSAPCPSVPDNLLDIISGKQFNVAYTVKDNCYDAIELTDGLQESSLKVDVTKTDCSLVQTNLNMNTVYKTDAQFIFTFVCPTPGKKEFAVQATWRGKTVALAPIKEEVLPPNVDYVEIEFNSYFSHDSKLVQMPDGTFVQGDKIGFGSISTPAYFYTKPYYTDTNGVKQFIGDYPKDIVLPSQMSSDLIQITWPDSTVYSNNIISQRKLGLNPWKSDYKRNEYIIYAANTPVGYYKVSSKYFKQNYWFYIEAGTADRSFSQVYVSDNLPTTLSTSVFPLRPRTSFVEAGKKLSLVFDLIDSAQNSSNEKKRMLEKGNSIEGTVFEEKNLKTKAFVKELDSKTMASKSDEFKDSGYSTVNQIIEAFEKDGFKVEQNGKNIIATNGDESKAFETVERTLSGLATVINSVSVDVIITPQKWARFMGIINNVETFANGQKMTVSLSSTINGFKVIEVIPDSAGYLFMTPNLNGEAIESCEYCNQLSVKPGQVEWSLTEPWVRYDETKSWFRFPYEVLEEVKVYRDKPTMVMWPRLRDSKFNYIDNWEEIGIHFDEKYPNGNFIYCSEDEKCKMEIVLQEGGMLPMKMCWFNVDPKGSSEKYVSPCEADIPEFKRLVFRNKYVFWVLKYTASTDSKNAVSWNLASKKAINAVVQRRATDSEEDIDAGNGPWKASMTNSYSYITYWNSGKETKKRFDNQLGVERLSWGVWEKQTFVIQLRTSKGQRYNRFPSLGNVRVECTLPGSTRTNCDTSGTWTEINREYAGEIGFVYQNTESFDYSGTSIRLTFFVKKDELEGVTLNPWEPWNAFAPAATEQGVTNPWASVWVVDVQLIPDRPFMAYIDMTETISKECPEKNCMKDTKVGSKSAFSVLLFDAYGNPTNLARNNNFLDIRGDYIWWNDLTNEFRPIPKEITQGSSFNRFNLNLDITKSGMYRWRSPWFTNCVNKKFRDECKVEYMQLVEAGPAVPQYSWMALVNGKELLKSNNMQAGANLTFNCYFRDLFFNYVPIIRINSTTDNTVTFTHTAPALTSPVAPAALRASTNIPMTKSLWQVPSTERIAPYWTVMVVNHTRAFENALQMRVNGVQTSCDYCLNYIHPGTPFNFDVYQLRSTGRIFLPEGSTSCPEIRNENSEYPQFLVEARDLWHNVHKVWPGGFNSIVGNIVNTGKDVIAEMIPPTRFEKGALFKLKDTFYDKTHPDYTHYKDITRAKYFFQVKISYGRAPNSWNKELLYPITFAGNGNNSYSMETVCNESFPSGNGTFEVRAGIWDSNNAEFTLMSPKEFNSTEFLITKITYRDVFTMVKLVRADTGLEDPKLNYTVTNFSPGKLRFRFNHTVKGIYRYKVMAMWDFNQNDPNAGFKTFEKTITLNVRAGPIDIVRFWSSDINKVSFFPKTVDYTQSVNVALYDSWNNTVELDQLPLDLALELGLSFNGFLSTGVRDATRSSRASFTIGKPFWDTKLNETQLEIVVQAKVPGIYSIRMTRNVKNVNVVRPFFFFENSKINLVESLDILYFAGVPSLSTTIQFIKVLPFDTLPPAASLSPLTTTTIKASDMVKFIMVLKDQYGNLVNTNIPGTVIEMNKRLRSLNLTVFDPTNSTELNLNYNVWQRFSKDGVEQNLQPMTLDSTTKQMVPIPLNRIDPACSTAVCLTWTWEIFNTSVVGIYSSLDRTVVYKMLVKPGPISVESLDLLLRCNDLSEKTKIFSFMKGSGKTDKDASSAAVEESNVKPSWISGVKNPSLFNCSTQTSPEFKIVFYDSYNNMVEYQPEGIINSQLYFGIYNKTTNDVDPTLVWCKDYTQVDAKRRRLLRRVLPDENDKFASRFKMCPDGTSQTYEYQRDFGYDYIPAMAWYTMSGDQSYMIGLKLLRSTTDIKKFFQFGVIPAFKDLQGSDLPMNADKSIVLPLSFSTRPLTPSKMTFDLRTTDGKRSSRWVYPLENISISSTFEFNSGWNPIYSVNYGDFPGMHELEIWSNEEYESDKPNFITVKANGYQLGGGKIVSWVNEATCRNDEGQFETDLIGIVFFDPIERIALSSLDKFNGSKLPNNSSDFEYVVNFEVFDENGFQCTPNAETISLMTTVSVIDPKGSSVAINDITVNKQKRGSFIFQPVVPGIYTVKINDYSATFISQSGSPTAESTVEIVYTNKQSTKDIIDPETNKTISVVEWDINFEAQSQIRARVYPKDKFGNAVEPTTELTKTYTYYFRLKNDPVNSNWHILFHESKGSRFRRNRRALQISNIELKVADNDSFDIIFNIGKKGTYEFMTLLRTAETNCLSCEFNIISSAVFYESTQIWYFDGTSGDYSYWNKSTGLSFPNTELKPSLRLYPIDESGNVLSNFPDLALPEITIVDNDKDIQIFTSVTVGPKTPRDYLILSASKGSETQGNGDEEIFYQFDLGGTNSLQDGVYDDLRAWEQGAYGPVSVKIQWGTYITEYNAFLNNKNTDGDNSPLSGDKSVFVNPTDAPNEKIVGEIFTSLLELRTTSDRRKFDVNVAFISYEVTNKKSTDNSLQITVSNSDVLGKFLVSVNTTTEYFYDGPLVIKFFYTEKGEKIELTKATLKIEFEPSSLDTFTLVTPLPLAEGKMGEPFHIRFAPKDIYGNIVIVDEENSGIQIYPPITFEEASNKMLPTASFVNTIDEDTSDLIITITPDRVTNFAPFEGSYTIASKFFPLTKEGNIVEYTFDVILDKPKPENCEFIVPTSNVVAGTLFQGYLIAKDPNGNTLPTSNIDYSEFKITYVDTNEKIQEISGEDMELTPIEEGYPNSVKVSILDTKVGQGKFIAYMGDVKLKCDGCAVTVGFGAPWIPFTKVLVSVGSLSVPVTTLQSPEGELFEFNVQFFDRYNNSVKQLNSTETAGAILRQNNIQWNGQEYFDLYANPYKNGEMKMSIIPDKEDTKTGGRLLADIEEDPIAREKFARSLVASTGYEMVLFYYVNGVNKGETSIAMTITGENLLDCGNGMVNKETTQVIADTLTVVAGETVKFKFVLKTEYNKLFSNIYPDWDWKEDVEMIVPLGVNHSISLVSQSTFEVALTSKVATYNRPNIIQFSINGNKLNKSVYMYVIPDEPDTSSTAFMEKFPERVEMGQSIYVKLLIKDKHGNNITDIDALTSHLSTRLDASVGRILDGPVGFGNAIFGFQYQASFPPERFGVYLDWTDEDGNKFPLNELPIETKVFTKLDPDRFDIIGSTDLFGITSVEGTSLFIYARDQSKSCYAGEVLDLTIRLMGPFLSNDPKDQTLAADQALDIRIDNVTQVATPDSACHYHYALEIPKETLYKTGYYNIDIFMNDPIQYKSVVARTYQMMNPFIDIASEPLKSFRLINVRPGPIVIENSVVTFNQKGRGSGPYTMVAEQSVIFDIQTYDKFFNKFDYDDWTEELEVSDLTTTEGIKANISKISVLKKTQGEYTVTISITTPSGEYNDMNIKIGEAEYRFSNLLKVDGPSSIIVLPGACSAAIPGIEKEDVEDGQVFIGERTLITIQCKDKFGNKVNRGGEAFENFILGTNLQKVESDQFPGTIIDNNNGTYSLVFVTPYTGDYKLYILFNQVLYGEPVEFIASIRCFDSAPTECPETNLCKESYYGCENLASILNTTVCPEIEKPILCKVDGEDACVSTGIECDCEEGYTKCDYTSACILDGMVDFLCPRFLDYACVPGEVKCPDGSCRKNLENCGSEYVCPPGTKQCDDLSCVLNDSECPTFFSCTASGSGANFYKCWDQTCVTKPEECPTKITCLPGQVVCLDSTCKNSALECPLPTDCVLDSMFKCGDQSCRNSISDCPQRTTCAKGKALCTDGTCQNDCLTQTKESAFLRRLSRKLQDFPSPFGVADSTKVICPGGEIESSPFLCPSIDTCPFGLLKCPDGSCKSKLNYCPSVTCTNGEYMCADGSCSNDPLNCGTRIQCPTITPVKCADGTCVSSAISCAPVLSCPPEVPYKCGTSGECRRNAKECPTATICPEGLPIKCTDGSCVKSPLHCENSSLMKSAPDGYIVCPDGSFATSLIVCSSTVSCASGLFRCVDGQCMEDLSSCKTTSKFAYDVIAVSSSLPYRCPDGSYRASYVDCPTMRVCPKDSPILCDDGNCRQSKTHCASVSECGFGMTKCPDGTCTNNVCSTQITCSVSEPYKCYDNSCRKDPRDCPQKTCDEDEPILCTDGTCKSHRLYCIPMWEPCSPEKPVRCPDSQCYPDSSFCKSYEECPPPFQKCYGGECAMSQDECKEVKCPVQTSYKCPFTGSCVTSPEFCENTLNGCIYNKPYKCKDGSCVENSLECPTDKEIEILCNSTSHKLCPNGACMDLDDSCMNVFGCPGNEKKCGDGTCIKGNEECPVAVCPAGTIKCNDGLCMESNADCRDSTMLDSSYCVEEDNNHNVPCANGVCVSTSEQCPPLFDCPSNMKRCGDGSCNVAALCPMADTCPGEQVRCESGACADDFLLCPNSFGCPVITPYKCVTGNKLGLCVSNINQCEDLIIAPSKINTKFCFGSTPYLCLDGTCASTPDICISKGYGCSESDIICPDGTCQEDYSLCLTTDKGCQIDQPYKCADDSCKMFPIDYFNDGNGCTPEIVCPDYMPYECQSGQCVGDPVMCGTVTEEIFVNTTCPQASPIMCDLGYCVARVTDCIGLNNNCPAERPFSCVLGLCAESPSECISLSTTIFSRRLERTKDISEKGGSSSSGEIDNGEPAADGSGNAADDSGENQQEDSGDQEENGSSPEELARCFDGSYLPSYTLCPIYPGCIEPSKPYKCSNGQCASSFFSCPPTPVCSTGTELCVDGVCRSSCTDVPFNGCGSESPLRCGDNTCARTLSECAGSSDCKNQNTPFRCSTGECVSDVSNCQRSALSYMSERFTLSLKPDQTVTQSFILDPNTLVKNGKITIPSGALLSPLDSLSEKKTTGDTQLRITPVAFSHIADVENPLGREEQAMARLIFPLTDGLLVSSSSIRSPIIRLESQGREDPYEYYRFPVVIELKTDIMASVQFDPVSHLCLGTIVSVGDGDDSKWACSSRQVQKPYNNVTQTIGFTVPKDGIYAVIFNPAPLPTDNKTWCERSLLCTNMWYILTIALFFLLVVAPLSFLFWRMYRYVIKYRESKKQITNIHHRYDEVMNTSTDTPFQSVKDKLEGIIFRKNPLLKPEEEENEEIKLLKKAVEKVDSDRKMLDMERKELMDRHNFYSREISRLRSELESSNRRKATIDTNFAENMSKAHDFL